MGLFEESQKKIESELIKKEDILLVVNEIDIFGLVIENPKVGKRILSPLRIEKDPSFLIARSKQTGSLYFIDFSTGEKGSCFDFIMSYYSLSFTNAILFIADRFNIKKSNVNTNEITKKRLEKNEKETKNIEIRLEYMKNEDFSYFYQFGISNETLRRHKVKCISEIYFNEDRKFIFTNKFPIFSYEINDKFRIYRPNNKRDDFKWFGTLNYKCVFGLLELKGLSNTLIITKSKKDVMVLEEYGYESIAPSSENVLIEKNVMVSMFLKYKYHYILFDNDCAGIEASKKYVDYCLDLSKKFILIPIFVPEEYAKDISDLNKKNKILTKQFLIDNIK